jgi:hypothetical protein
MMAQGAWIMKRPTPTIYGKDLVDFISFMKNVDKNARPHMTQVSEKLATVKAAWLKTRTLCYNPDPAALFTGELTSQHAKLWEFRQTQDKFFTDERTAEEKEFHNQMEELRADGYPYSTEKGSYIGQFCKKAKFNGRGILL